MNNYLVAYEGGGVLRRQFADDKEATLVALYSQRQMVASRITEVSSEVRGTHGNTMVFPLWTWADWQEKHGEYRYDYIGHLRWMRVSCKCSVRGMGRTREDAVYDHDLTVVSGRPVAGAQGDMSTTVVLSPEDALVVVNRKGEELHLREDDVVALLAVLGEGIMISEDYAEDVEYVITPEQLDNAAETDKWLEGHYK